MTTALLQIIAGALILNIPLIIMWVWLAKREGNNPFGVEPKEWRKAVKSVPYGKCKNCKCKHEWPNERCEA